MRSVMTHNFSRVPSINIPRSSFDRSRGFKGTCPPSYLIPFFMDEVLPGDTYKVRSHAIFRMATQLYPIMDNVNVSTFYFFVPNRIVWQNWKKFMGEQVDPGDSISYVIPTLTTTDGGVNDEESLKDYFGIPTKIAGLEVNALPFRAYNRIWAEWFRSEYLQDSPALHVDDGATENISDYALLKRGKRHDYFTSCLPWPVRDNMVVDVPLGTSAPVIGDGNTPQGYSSVDATVRNINVDSGSSINLSGASAAGSLRFDAQTGLIADLSSATASTINQIREAFQVQRLLERDARGGTRYVEIVASHFGIINAGGDARFQRPEYLGGLTTRFITTPVQATSQVSTASLFVGDLAGRSEAHVNGHGFSKSFTEHGYIIGLFSINADLNYQQGLHRLWSRSTRYDFYFPSLAFLGEGPVYNKEIYADGSANDDLVFGYQERWAEMRYGISQITGLFRSNCTAPLDAWHLAQEFASLPTLGDTFIQDNPPIDRVVAVASDPTFIFDIYNEVRCVRPMPVYSVPGFLDHF